MLGYVVINFIKNRDCYAQLRRTLIKNEIREK
jgi:hypothetical protein